MMKAVHATEYGSPDILQIADVPKPASRKNEVLIRVRAATVSSGDWRIRNLTVPTPPCSTAFSLGSCALDSFSSRFFESQNVLVLDNRRFHKAKDLSVPDNIRLVFLPPYSPELNPGERLWHDLKDHLRVPPARDTLGDVNAAASSLQKAGPARWS
jgi:hypothetical protein